MKEAFSFLHRPLGLRLLGLSLRSFAFMARILSFPILPLTSRLFLFIKNIMRLHFFCRKSIFSKTDPIFRISAGPRTHIRPKVHLNFKKESASI
jgi:hypothetical protein